MTAPLTQMERLRRASRKGDVAAMEELLRDKVDPNAHAKGGDGPLHEAARGGHEPAVRLLLAHKAQVNRKGENGWTALMRAAVDASSLPVVKLLLDAGADVSILNAMRDNVLGALVTEKDADVEIARLLIDHGADFKDYKADYPLVHFAASHGSEAIVALLIEKGARFTGKDREGRTPMDAAIQHSNHAVIKRLLANGADPDSRDRSGFGKTLLQYAADSGDLELVRAVRARQEAKRGGGKGGAGLSTGAMVAAARKGDLAMVKTLIESGLPIDEPEGEEYELKRDPRGETALMAAAGRGHLDLLRHLIASSANLDARDRRGSPALHYAASGGPAEAVAMLLAAGADVRAINDFNWNALMQAALKGRKAVAELLLAAGSPHDAIDLERGVTAMWLARHSGSTALVELLERHGARDRAIRAREPGAPWFLVTDCDICTYLPHSAELSHDYAPEEFPGLEVIHSTGEVNYKAEESEMVKRCIHCGTCYRHYHYIDTEDSIGGAGPVCSHYFLRFNLLMLRKLLAEAGKTAELAEVERGYPGVIAAFERLMTGDPAFTSPVVVYVVESLADFYIMKGDWASLRRVLLDHPRPDLAMAAAFDLLGVYGSSAQERRHPSYYEARNCTAEVRSKLRRLIGAHKCEFQELLARHVANPETKLRSLIEALQRKAREVKLLE